MNAQLCYELTVKAIQTGIPMAAEEIISFWNGIINDVNTLRKENEELKAKMSPADKTEEVE